MRSQPAIFRSLTLPDDDIVVGMAEHFEEVISVRLAELSQSIDARFDAVDARLNSVDVRFDEVRDHFAEMRDFTTFCFDKLGRELRDEIRSSEGRLSRRLDRHELVLGEILTEVKALRPRWKGFDFRVVRRADLYRSAVCGAAKATPYEIHRSAATHI